MKILSILITHNAGDILGFHFRHYDRFVDEYWVFDDRSTDGTQEFLKANPRVKQRAFTGMEGLYEEQNLGLIYATYPEAVGKFDWVMCPDPDEFLIPIVEDAIARTAMWLRGGFKIVLHDAKCNGYEAISSQGFNLLGAEFPKDDGRSQIYELNPIGVNAPIYSKPIVFRPEITIRWMRGKHQLENCNPRVSPPLLKLLHARYFGASETRRRNAINYERCGLMNGDRGPAWSCSPEYDGEHLEGSPLWADWARTQAFDVLEASI